MAHVVNRPPIQFTCTGCHCTIEARDEEFRKQNTMPPTWKINCPECNLINTVSPERLIAKVVGHLF